MSQDDAMVANAKEDVRPKGEVKTLRILHLVASVGKTSGGLGSIALDLACHQKTATYQVSIWCLDYDDNAAYMASLCEMENELRTWPISGLKRIGYSHSMKKAILAGDGVHFDLIHQHGIWLALSDITSTWSKKLSRPTVVAPQGALDSYALRRSRLKKWIASQLYENRNLHNAACLQALSEAEVSAFRDYGLRNPIAVIPNGISETWLQSEGCKESFRNRFSLPADRRVLLFLSRIHPKKGLPLLVSALSQIRAYLADWILVIAGPDEVGHQREIEALVKNLGLEKYVRFVGPLFGEDKRNAFAAADLFVLPTYSEGAPIAILEALGAGVPVLATHGTPWQDLEVYDCGWWVAVSVDDVKDALVDALQKSTYDLKMMGFRGKQLVKERYSWSSMSQKSVILYEWLVGHGECPDFLITD